MPLQNQNIIKVGIAGVGRSGWHFHAMVLHALANQYRVEAVTDPDPIRRQEAVGKFGCKAYEDFSSLLADSNVDLIVVATPSPMHHEQTIQALFAGKDVVCEKPMAADTAQADAMIAAAKHTGRILTVFQNQRYMPSFLKVREVIASAKLGRIVQIRMAVHSFARRWDWQTLKEFNGGELNNTGSHFLDQALILLGPEEPDIFCDLQRVLTSGDAEDHCKIILRAPQAPMIDVEISRACAYGQNFWTVMGTCGGLTGTFDRISWKYIDFSKLPPRPVDRNPTPDRSYNTENLSWQEEIWELPKELDSTQTCFYKDLYQTLRGKAPLPVTPKSVRRQIDLLQRCHQLCRV